MGSGLNNTAISLSTSLVSPQKINAKSFIYVGIMMIFWKKSCP
jgi:hypothetical protein